MKKPTEEPEGGAPGLPELIRYTHQTAQVPGPEQQEAIELLQSFGFDPSVEASVLTDEYVFAVLNRSSALIH